MAAVTLSELRDKIEKSVTKSLKTHVALNIKSTMVEMVEKNVYGVYEPVEYERREYDRGLADPDNMKVTLNGLSLTIENVAPINIDYPNYDGCHWITPRNLAALVEYGDKSSGGEYTHKHSSRPYGPRFLYPRPFIQPTIDEVERGQQHVNGIHYGLIKDGFRVSRR